MKSLRSKKAARAVLMSLLFCAAGTAKAQTGNISFADENVKSICVANWDTNGDGELSYDEAAAVTDLGWTLFYGNGDITSFNELQYFTGLTSIGSSAFYGCTGLTSVVIPNSVTSIGGAAFSNCTGLTSVVIPNSVTSIGSSAFYGCTGLTSVVIPNSVTSIGIAAFSNCTGLTSVEIPNSVTSIGSSAFSGCSGLEQIVVDTGNTVYDSRNNCDAIIETATNTLIAGCKNTVIPNSVTSIGSSAFGGCTGLTSVEIGNSVTSIGGAAFSGCTGLTSVVIPNSVTSIGPAAFSNCTGLTSVEIPNSVTSIGRSAFCDCTGLTSVEIGNSVTSIGGAAFSGCTGLATMAVFAETPPSLGDYVFDGVNKSIPVYVPAGTVAAYRAAYGWDEFTNYIELQEYGITATANPAEGGTTTGAGTYMEDQTCTLTATPNDGYSFINWTKDGEEVSTEATYSFTVTEAGDYVANFSENHWMPNGAPYEENMTLAGVIQINGEEQQSTMLEVGAFCGDECRGSARPVYFAPAQRYILNLVVYGESGDQLTFKLFDHELGEELDLVSPEAVAFTADGIGDLSEPYPLNFLESYEITVTAILEEGGTANGAGVYNYGQTCTLTATANEGYTFVNWTLNGEVVSTDAEYSFTVTAGGDYTARFDLVQAITFGAGWNWWSTYIECENADMLSQLESGLGEFGQTIKSQSAFANYSGGSWNGSLSGIENEQSYRVKTSAAVEVSVAGVPAQAASHPITLNPGWTWMGYPSAVGVSVAGALSGFTPEANDVIKGRSSFATYYTDGSTGQWFGTLNGFVPGQGYMYKSNATAAKTLTLQTGRGETGCDNITPEDNHYRPAEASFANNMTVTATVELNGMELAPEPVEGPAQYELAAFVGEECRGSVRLMYVEPLDRYMAFLTVFGEPNETLSFRLTDGMETSLSHTELAFVSDGMTGTLTEPFVVRFDGMAGLDAGETARVKVYPNPSDGIFHVEGQGIRQVEVFNGLGQAVVSEAVAAGSMQIDLRNRAEGIYVLRIVTDGGVSMKRIVKK